MSLKDKFKAHTKAKAEKTGRKDARARVSGEVAVPKLEVEQPAPAAKVLRTLSDAINDDDIDLIVTAWRDAAKATRKFRDIVTKKWIEEPDHKVRVEAGKMLAAYKEGLPVQRQVVLNTSFEDLHAQQSRMMQSPEAARALQSMGVISLPSVTESNESGAGTGAAPEGAPDGSQK